MTERMTGKIDHNWGYEIIWSSNDNYCGKMLVFPTPGIKTDLILHKEKRKSWFVNAGRFRLVFVDTKTGELKEVILEEGKTVDLGELSPHQLESLLPDSIMFEVGTAENPEDKFILSPGQSQRGATA